MPGGFKHAGVSPLIKKNHTLQRGPEKNCPVSRLCFTSKLVQRAVAKQLNDHIQAEDLDNQYQSAYKMAHSTETALLNKI